MTLKELIISCVTGEIDIYLDTDGIVTFIIKNHDYIIDDVTKDVNGYHIHLQDKR